MARSISVSYEAKPAYEILLRDSFDDMVDKIAAIGYSESVKICIVSDTNVAGHYLNVVKELLKEKFDTVISFVFDAGEKSKNMETVELLYEQLIIHNFDRHDLLLALGGGVVGDLTGFTASTYLRGIDFIQVPTSLLSQVDSSIGGKTGVDFKQYKNMVGAFYQPKLVYMNLSALKTLPKRQLSSGIAEILKHGLIKERTYFMWMKEHYDDIFSLDLPTIEEMIYRSCEIKRIVVENDPKEKGERALLNFGHTIGHAVEKLSDFSLYHGECVSIGSIAASYLSYLSGNITKEELDDIQDTFCLFELPVRVQSQNAEQILVTTKSDKKMKAGKIAFILLHEIGDAYIYHDFSDSDILHAIKYILGEENELDEV